MKMSTGREEGYRRSAGAGDKKNNFINLTAFFLLFVEIEIGLLLQVFVRKVIELHDKYLAYVNDCFQNHTLFHKVLF